MAYIYFCLLAVLSTFSSVSSAVLDERKCSKFDYEYKILERIIFLENKNAELERKQMVSERKNEELNEILVEQRLEMERFVKEQDHARRVLEAKVEEQANVDNETFQTLVSGLEQQQKASTEWQNQVETKFTQNFKETKQVHDELKTEIATVNKTQHDLRQSIDDHSDKTTGTSVAFSATIYRSPPTYKSGDTIVFDLAVTNNGNAYNSTTGVFTAPQKGTYLFALTLQISSQGSAGVFLRKGRQILGMVFPRGDAFDSSSAISVVNLVKGDAVFASFSSGSSKFWYNYVCIFSGAML